jgi:enterochelin esterase-like enzyme
MMTRSAWVVGVVVAALAGRWFISSQRQAARLAEADRADDSLRRHRQVDQIFTNFGISHTFETYDGDHTNRVVERIEQKVLPFFSKNLKR